MNAPLRLNDLSDGRAMASRRRSASVSSISGDVLNSFGGQRHRFVEGAANFCDLGDVVTSSGHRVSDGRVYRSGSLHTVSNSGLDALSALGIRTVLDLRSHDEINTQGRFPDDLLPVRWEHIASPAAPVEALQSPKRFAPLVDHPDPMALVFVDLMHSMAPELARAVRILANPANLPAVIHCTEGKDRTGLLAAIVHLTVGVPLETALDDFELGGMLAGTTPDDLVAQNPQLASLGLAKLERVAGTSRGWVMAALSVTSGDGGLPAWLTRHGCDIHQQTQLRRALLDLR